MRTLLGVWAALLRVRRDAGLLFVDGHLDCYDGQSSPTGEGADMELAALLGVGPSGHARRALTRLGETADGFWLHLDLDVLSASALPAVDYADERGLSWEQLGELLGVALGSSQLIGASVVILNPTLDTNGAGARAVVQLLTDAQNQARQS